MNRLALPDGRHTPGIGGALRAEEGLSIDGVVGALRAGRFDGDGDGNGVGGFPAETRTVALAILLIDIPGSTRLPLPISLSSTIAVPTASPSSPTRGVCGAISPPPWLWAACPPQVPFAKPLGLENTDFAEARDRVVETNGFGFGRSSGFVLPRLPPPLPPPLPLPAPLADESARSCFKTAPSSFRSLDVSLCSFLCHSPWAVSSASAASASVFSSFS